MRLAPIKAALIDLSGTLHIENKITPGAVSALQKLRSLDVELKFVTNTTKEDLSSLHSRLRSLDFEIAESEIYTSLIAARNLLRKMTVRPFLMLSESAKKDFAEFETKDPNCVVVGLSPEHFNYASMNEAFRLLMEGFPLVAIHKARYFKRADGFALGPGPFVEALQYATDTQAIVVGKPEKRFFLGAANEIGCDPKDCVMIGDDARDDVGGAMDAGMQGILVKTGKYRTGDESKLSKPPTCITNTFAEAVKIIVTTQTNA